MQPTAFALDLIGQARPILRGLQRALSPRYEFDPATSQRVFRLAAPDFVLALFVHLLKRLRSEAPGVSVEWTTARHPMLLDIAEGQIDVALAPAQVRPPKGVTAEAVGALQWQCFGRKGHPAFSRWGAKAWSRWPHVAPHIDERLTNPVTLAASSAGLQRTVAGWVPHFSAIAPVIATSDLLATAPSIALDKATLQSYRLERREVPFPIAPIPFVMLWNTSRRSDPEIAWFRERLRPIVMSTFTNVAG
jgi:DNA-binding transcriptional LysR family regulator